SRPWKRTALESCTNWAFTPSLAWCATPFATKSSQSDCSRLRKRFQPTAYQVVRLTTASGIRTKDFTYFSAFVFVSLSLCPKTVLVSSEEISTRRLLVRGALFPSPRFSLPSG